MENCCKAGGGTRNFKATQVIFDLPVDEKRTIFAGRCIIMEAKLWHPRPIIMLRVVSGFHVFVFAYCRESAENRTVSAIFWVVSVH